MIRMFLSVLILVSIVFVPAHADSLDFDQLLGARNKATTPHGSISSQNIESDAQRSHANDRNIRVNEENATETRRAARFDSSDYGKTRSKICGGDFFALNEYCNKQCSQLSASNSGIFSSSDRDKCKESCTQAKFYLCRGESTCFGFRQICTSPCSRFVDKGRLACEKYCDKVQSDCHAQGGK